MGNLFRNCMVYRKVTVTHRVREWGVRGFKKLQTNVVYSVTGGGSDEFSH